MSNQVPEKDRWPFQINYLPESFFEKSERELNESLENRITCLHDLKKLIEDDKILNKIDFHPDLLKLFLKYTKHNTKRALSSLHNYIVFRRKYSDYFKPISYEDATAKFGNVLTFLPWRTPDGCAVAHFQHGNFEGNETDADEYERLLMTLFQQALRQPMTQVNGFKGIHDCKNVSLKMVRLASPGRMYKLIQAYASCLPGRIKEIHFINEPFVLKILTQILKPMLPEKFSKRLFFHSRPQDLLNHFPSYVIPEKYGGSLKECYMADFIKMACEEQTMCSLGGQPNFSWNEIPMNHC